MGTTIKGIFLSEKNSSKVIRGTAIKAKNMVLNNP
jgi:hypothetical protein